MPKKDESQPLLVGGTSDNDLAERYIILFVLKRHSKSHLLTFRGTAPPALQASASPVHPNDASSISTSKSEQSLMDFDPMMNRDLDHPTS